MSYRPQYAFPEPPSGWVEEDFVYYFDQTNVPALGNILPGTFLGKIPLPLQPDAPFKLRGIQVSGNLGNTCLTFYDAHEQPLARGVLEADRSVSGQLQANPPIGKLPVAVEPEVPCPPGAVILVDILVP